MEMWNYLRCGGNGIGLKCNRRMLFGIELLVTTSKNKLGLVCYRNGSEGILNEWCGNMMMDQCDEFCKKKRKKCDKNKD